ncbi:hypothetical protein BLSTO_05480 [Blastocystis sp. subtype 1]
MAVLRRVADAFQKRDLHMLRAEPAFFEDEVVRFHMRFLSNELMEKNFLKIVEPYDVVEIGFVARKMELPEEEIVRKLSQMILDKKLSASLDQGKGLLIMLPSASQHVLAENVLSTITELNEVVDALKVRADAYNAKLQEIWFYHQGHFFIIYGDHSRKGLTVSLGPDRLTFLLFVCIFLAGGYFIWTTTSEQWGTTLALVVRCMYVVGFSSFLYTGMCNPGIVLKTEDNSLENQEKLESLSYSYCSLCDLYRPPRAAHCSACGVCFEGFDHHCTVMG